MTKKELESYCKSIGLVKSKSKNRNYYGFTYNSIYASPHDMIVAYDKKNKYVVCARYIYIPSDFSSISCAGFIEISDVQEIKSKINELIEMFRINIKKFIKYQINNKIKEIEGDFV